MALRCVIVDDNLGFLHAARLVLEQGGLQVVGVATCRDEALRAGVEVRPDVSLLDIDLGGESGFDVARRLADDRDSGPGKLILISTHSEEDLVDLIKESPAIGFLGKPSLSATTIKGLLETSGTSS